MSGDIDFTQGQLLDLRGLTCPVPILRTSKAMQGLDAGAMVHVLTSDMASLHDFPAFARQTGNELLASKTTAEGYHFLLRRRIG